MPAYLFSKHIGTGHLLLHVQGHCTCILHQHVDFTLSLVQFVQTILQPAATELHSFDTMQS